MKEITGDLWDYHNQGHWICITTNGDVNKQGLAVMGRGVALQAAERFRGLRAELARYLLRSGNQVYVVHPFHVITFPVKHHWRDKADVHLIEQSAKQLMFLHETRESIYLPRPGCGAGRLSWATVKPILTPILDDRFVVVEQEYNP